MPIPLHDIASAVKILIPAVGPLAIAFVAAIAIKGNRKTTIETLRHESMIEHRQFYRDSLRDTYLGLTLALERCAKSDYEQDLWEGTEEDLEAKYLLFASIVVKASFTAWYRALGRQDVEELDRIKDHIIDVMRKEVGTGPAGLSVIDIEVPELKGLRGAVYRLAIRLRLRKPRPTSYLQIRSSHD